MLLALSGCQKPGSADVPGVTQPGITPADPTSSTETIPAETEPPATEPLVPASGNSGEATCLSSYTVSDNDAVLAAHDTVATMDGEALTNADLQIYYWMAVNNYRAANHSVAPDFTQPLDQQLCALSEEPLTWQQYFLQQAFQNWRSAYAMTMVSRDAKLPVEEAYKPNAKKHAENINSKIYNLNLLYGYDPSYEIADAHQTYLNTLSETLEQDAQAQGYETLSALVKDFAGVATSGEYLLDYAKLSNEGYMYATALSYYIEPTAEEVEAFFAQREADYAELGITKDSGYTVNVRHILVTDNREDKDLSASKLLKKWQGNRSEANFSDLAFAHSEDTGSNAVGGLYSGISKGQFTAEIDAWCFDPARQSGDTTIITTDSGDHILYFSGTNDIWFTRAEEDLIAYLLSEQIAEAAEDYTVSVDYSAVRLAQPQNSEFVYNTGNVLYPDIAHERFPVAPLYLQQDYEGTMYGRYSLVTYGCGITTMSMLASYMTDDEWTPPEMCALYGKYCSEKGTAHAMFTEVPTDRGFHAIERVFTWDEALAALEDGYMVVTLQRDGYWTRGGHYLLLHNLLETEEGTMVQVRDSNILNYGKLDGHTTGYFSLKTIPGNSRCYWIYQKKVVRTDSCARCGQPTDESLVPADLFASDYFCPKCHTAMNRRSAYLDGCNGVL